MKKSQPKAQPVKKISLADAFKMWMSGTKRSALVESTGLSRGELRKGFKKVSGKSWKELSEERKGGKRSNKEGLRRKAA